MVALTIGKLAAAEGVSVETDPPAPRKERHP